jgi:hypothetical protein
MHEGDDCNGCVFQTQGLHCHFKAYVVHCRQPLHAVAPLAAEAWPQIAVWLEQNAFLMQRLL